jgi:hypothetical protein
LDERRVLEAPFRVFALGGLLHPNLATAFDLDDVRAMDALYPERYVEYVNTFVTPIFDRFTGIPTGRTEGSVAVRDNRWLNLANVRYVVSPPGPLPDEGPRPPVPDRLPPVYVGEVVVRESLDVFPRAFLLQSAVGVSGPAQAIERMRQSSFDPARQAVVEGALPELFPNALRGPFDPAEGRVVRHERGNVTVRTNAAGPRLLVLTDVYYPGWRARVDGAEAHIYPTNLAFRGVLLPPGSHTVEFSYEPESASRGMALAAVSLLALLAAAAGLSLRRRVDEG